MQSHTTPDRHGYSVKFSPFDANHLLLATSQLFGLAGGGTLFLLKQSSVSDEKGGLTELCRLEWSDGLFDVAWCPYANNIAATASGDGSLQIWGGLEGGDSDGETSSLKATPATPIILLQEHKNEVYSIDWGEQWNHHQLISGSWDGSVKLWDCNRHSSVSTYVGHTDLVYCAKFSPLIANIFSSVGTDGNLNLWNSLDFSGKPMMTVQAAPASEVLACDWSHFDRNILATGGSDGQVRGWDLRNMRQHLFEMFSGEFAIRRLAFSPNLATVLATANYDFTTRIWDFSQSFDALEVSEHHSEFVCGLDWNINQPHQLADCGWDAVINIFTPGMLHNLKE